jgi:flavodoxin
MKVLVTYFTQTGNTEKIAKAIQGEASKGGHKTELKKLGDLKPDSTAQYDVVFIGTPIHGGNLAGPATDLLTQLPKSAKFKLAGFVTHSAPAYRQEDFERGIASFETTAKEKGIKLAGCFECQGKLDPALHPMVKQIKNLPDQEFESMIAEGNKHPNAEDEKKASEFARKVLA